ncbi:hypothetical protein [Limobrevibacterium gyesilva]|uniref:hypothetical protein n=1 Tax=Limobrevibacterium gyesilva TaxID=2991712 RepID=UPI0022276E1E|nr:hypothetical protein [Limobrevibacterium gyesilva]
MDIPTLPPIVASDHAPASALDALQIKGIRQQLSLTPAAAQINRGSANPALTSPRVPDRRRPGRVEYTSPELIALLRQTSRPVVPDARRAIPAAETARAGNDAPGTVNNQSFGIEPLAPYTARNAARTGDHSPGKQYYGEDGELPYSLHITILVEDSANG